MEGKFLGYPKCCRKEYAYPTYEDLFNPWIVKQFRIPYRFKIEAVQKLLQNEKVPEDFLFLAQTQTPCSVACLPSLALLRKWRKVLEKYDAEAVAALQRFNTRNNMQEFEIIAKDFRKKKITAEQFRKGYIFPS